MRDWKPIELLSHARHDWMNRIQLIKGYLSMGNIEKVNEIIDQIIQMSTQESKLSNIQLPEFATLLLTYNWISPAFILNYEIEGNGKITNIDDLFITNWFKAFFQLVDQAVSPEEDNELIVKIALNHKESHRFFIEFME